MMLNKNLLMAVTLAATAATTTVTAQSNERTDCDICAFPIKPPGENTVPPGLSKACEDSDERILAIINSDSACSRSWDAFCIVKYNDCYNNACGVSQQDLVDSIAATGGPTLEDGTSRPISRDQILDTCAGTNDPTPRPTLPPTPPPQSAATSLPTPCIPEVYGDCVEDCEEEFGLSVSDCIEYCANGGGGQYGGKGGKGGKGGSVCGAKGGKGGNKGGKGGKSGYYQDECCEFVPGYGGKGGKGGKSGYFGGYGSKGGKVGYGGYGSKGGKGYNTRVGFAAVGFGTTTQQQNTANNGGFAAGIVQYGNGNGGTTAGTSYAYTTTGGGRGKKHNAGSSSAGHGHGGAVGGYVAYEAETEFGVYSGYSDQSTNNVQQVHNGVHYGGGRKTEEAEVVVR
mmetsp:Transcript_33575/g.37507  ORF Transcript_33575/g.37507 Transcript_33575/m.37507 type:complete len:397 (-) Transcript_33575:247-1437(-)